MDYQKLTDLRLRLLANGYTPIRNKDKRTFMKGWPDAEIDEDEIRRWGRRHKLDIGTGLRIENGLAAIDIDVDDELMMREIANAIFDAVPILADETTPLLVRKGKGFKEAWFVRTDEPFTRIHSRGFVAPGDDPDDKVQRVEIFGGASPRQFGAYGPHTVDDQTGEIRVLYEWVDAGPATTPLADLPVLSKKDFFAISDAISNVLLANGWEPVLASKAGESEATRVYDLTPEMKFDCIDGVTRTLDEAREWVLGDPPNARCSASFLEGASAKNLSRCLMSITQSGVLAIWESAGGVTHVEAGDTPPTQAALLDLDRVAEKLQELKDRRKTKVRGSDEMLVAAAKLRAGYAYWPRSGGGSSGLAVPIWSSSMDAGTPITAFRLQHMPNCQIERGPRGGEKKINPVDVWMADPQRVTVEGLRMRPDMPRPTFEEEGRTYINVYDPPVFFDADKGDAQPGIGFIEHLIPDEVERRWFLQWLSFKLQAPHIPGPGVVMVAHNTFGTGRGTLGVLLGKLFGSQYVHSLPFNDLTGKSTQSQYNEWAAEALIVVVNESSESHDGSVYRTKKNTYEHLKELVDPRPTMRSIKVKGLKNYRALSSTSFLIATNHADALPIPESDRRFCVLRNGGTAPDRYWRALNAWLEVPENIAAFHEHLLTVDLAGYSPFEAPPVFEGKARMVEEGKSDIDRALDIVDQNLVSTVFVPAQIVALVRRVAETYDLGLPETGPRLDALVKRLLQSRYYRVGVKHGQNWFLKVGDMRYPLYATSERAARKWTNTHHDEVRRECLKNGSPTGSGLGGNVTPLVTEKLNGLRQLNADTQTPGETP